MINILVVSEHRMVFDELIQIFFGSNINYEYIESWNNTSDYLETEPVDFIFLINNNVNNILDILGKISDSQYRGRIPVLCFTEFISSEERSKLFDFGAFDVIGLPIMKDELIVLLSKYGFSFNYESETIQPGMKGRLSDIGIIDLIQILEEGKKSAVLTLKRNGTSGQILFKDGDIYSADYRKFSGMSAILNIVGWLRGEFQVNFTDEEFEKKIELNNQQILYEAIQRIDARANLLKQLPPVDDTLLISPDIDIFKLHENDFKYIKFFQGGNTIYKYLLNFDVDELNLLEKVSNFIAKKMLLTRMQFDSHITEYEAEIQKKGLKGTLKRWLKKEDSSKINSKQIHIKESEKSIIDDQKDKSQLFDHVLKIDPSILIDFEQKIAEL